MKRKPIVLIEPRFPYLASVDRRCVALCNFYRWLSVGGSPPSYLSPFADPDSRPRFYQMRLPFFT